MALACILPFVIPALLFIGTTNAYIATIFWTLLPTLGLGFVIYGFMDRVVDYLWGTGPGVAKTVS